ncbi:hypothetical protein Kyoto47B_09270 [Helicobacter pylori]
MKFKNPFFKKECQNGKQPNALIQSQNIKSNQAIELKHPFKKRSSVFPPR